jgi:hypothetical protein
MGICCGKVVVGIGAKPTIGPFVEAGLKSAEGAIEVLFEIVQIFNLGLVFQCYSQGHDINMSLFLSFFLPSFLFWTEGVDLQIWICSLDYVSVPG